MRLYLYFFILFSTLAFSQKKKPSVEIDSVKYYLDLSIFNGKDNNFKNALYYSQRAIDYAHLHKNKLDEAKSYASMGHIYYELNKGLSQ